MSDIHTDFIFLREFQLILTTKFCSEKVKKGETQAMAGLVVADACKDKMPDPDPGDDTDTDTNTDPGPGAAKQSTP